MNNDDRLEYVRRVDPGAIEEYEARTLKNATQAREVDVFAPEGILTELGPVHAITYRGTLQGDTELYEHAFVGDAQPDLMVDARNTLHLVGGDYHVADVGIVDGSSEHATRANPVGQKPAQLYGLALDDYAYYLPIVKREVAKEITSRRKAGVAGAIVDGIHPDAALAIVDTIAAKHPEILDHPSRFPFHIKMKIATNPTEHDSSEYVREVFAGDDREADDLLGYVTYRHDDRGGSVWTAQVIDGHSRPFLVQDHGSFLGALDAARAWVLENEHRISNPMEDANKWNKESWGDGFTTYWLAGDTMTGRSGLIVPYSPRKSDQVQEWAAEYEQEKGQKVPKGTKYLRHIDGQGITAHKTLKTAKKIDGSGRSRRNPSHLFNPGDRVRVRPSTWEKKQGIREYNATVVREYTMPPGAPDKSYGFFSHPGSEVYVVQAGTPSPVAVPAKQLEHGHGVSFNPALPQNPKERPFSRAPLGSGGRFAACVSKMQRRGNVKDPKALCASIGRKKYGAKKMASLARAGKHNPHHYDDEESAMDLWLTLTDPFYIQLAEITPGGELKHVWMQTARETIDQDLSPKIESFRAIEGSLSETHGDWVDLPKGEGRYVWRQIDPVMVPFIERTESTEVIDKWQVREMDSKLYSFNLTTAEADTIINALRSHEQRARDEDIRLMARQLKGLYYEVLNEGKEQRARNPVVTNQISPNSPVVNAGVLAMPAPGPDLYNYPRVNAGALAAAPNYPGDYDFQGVTNGSHGLLGPQVRRSLPGQPIANPVIPKKPAKWIRDRNGIDYQIFSYEPDGGSGWAQIFAYKPRSRDPQVAWNSRSNAGAYEQAKGQKVPKGTKYIVRALPPGAGWGQEQWSAHKTLAPAKRRAEKLLKVPAR
tara:strand:+ start:249 stop:2885 length:2637 start_codon:yes stop_codon:yes gene_type:complete